MISFTKIEIFVLCWFSYICSYIFSTHLLCYTFNLQLFLKRFAIVAFVIIGVDSFFGALVVWFILIWRVYPDPSASLPATLISSIQPGSSHSEGSKQVFSRFYGLKHNNDKQFDIPVQFCSGDNHLILLHYQGIATEAEGKPKWSQSRWYDPRQLNFTSYGHKKLGWSVITNGKGRRFECVLKMLRLEGWLCEDSFFWIGFMTKSLQKLRSWNKMMHSGL